jgi:hypothetical protein
MLYFYSGVHIYEELNLGKPLRRELLGAAPVFATKVRSDAIDFTCCGDPGDGYEYIIVEVPMTSDQIASLVDLCQKMRYIE